MFGPGPAHWAGPGFIAQFIDSIENIYTRIDSPVGDRL